MKELDEIRARLEDATPGPWRIDDEEQTVRVSYDETDRGGEIMFDRSAEGRSWWLREFRHDAEFIANAPTDLARLLAAIDAVEALHLPIMEFDEPVGCAMCDWDATGGGEWPCQTLAAITAALTPTPDVPSGALGARAAVVAPVDAGTKRGPENGAERRA